MLPSSVCNTIVLQKYFDDINVIEKDPSEKEALSWKNFASHYNIILILADVDSETFNHY